MCFHDRTMMCRRIAILASLAVALVLAGCESQSRSRKGFPSSGQRLVGGGLMIAWEAPEEGTVYLVEKETGKLVETRSMEEGEAYTFAVESVVDAEDLEEMLGINFARAEFLLYFEPVGKKRQAEPTE
jgi:hypothetical protein